MNAGELVFVIGVLLTVAGLLGVTWAVFRTSAATKTIELYQAENEVMGKMNARLEQETLRLQSKVDTQQASLQALQEAVTQRAEVAKLMAEIKAAEKERRDEHQAHQMLMRDILAQLKHRRGEIGL